MVHDEKLTVPPSMYTPPPCKHKRKTCGNPIGAMGTLQGLFGTHRLLLTGASLAAVVQARVKASASAVFRIPMGSFEQEQAPIQKLCCR